MPTTLTVKPGTDGSLDLKPLHEAILTEVGEILKKGQTPAMQASGTPAAGTPAQGQSQGQGAGAGEKQMDAGAMRFFPSTPDLKDDAFGPYTAAFLAKALHRMVPVTSNPALGDYVAWLLIDKFAGFLGAGGKRSAQTVLTFDFYRNVLPVIDKTMADVIAKLPVLYKGKAFTPPVVGTPTRTAPLAGQGAHMGASPGGGSVIGGGNVLNI